VSDLTVGAAVAIPLITAFIGYITNWAAVKMIFYPREFVGIGPVGWQGVIPARNEKFANDVAGNVEDVLTTRDLAERLHPDEMEALLSDRLDTELPGLIEEIADLIRPGVWAQMAPEAREMVIAQIRNEGSELAREVFDDLQQVVDEVLDLRSLVVELLSGENAERLSRLFQRMGRKELKFIEYYGGLFGFLVGIVQVGFFGIFGQWWTMPVVGVLVGLGTNWLALQMIFRPMEPRRFVFVTYQGMFPKRQAEIAKEYGDVAAGEIFTPSNLFRALSEGEGGTRVARLLLQKVSDRIDAQRPVIEMLAQEPVSDELLARVKLLVVARVGERVPQLQEELEQHVQERLGVATLVEERLAALDKPEFERLLRGIFEQDEWILIVIGGVLGGLVGLLQAGVVLA
jgi:uncharacterized membrane protein YheB (UPF0754 family)